MSGKPSSALRDGALWGGAAAVVLAAHLGGALWILHSAKAAAPPGLPDPVFVDLAPLPEAAAPPEDEDTPELAEAVPEPEPEPQPEPEPEPEVALPEPLPELEPIADMNSLFPPPPDAVVLQKTARPKERPEPEPDPAPKLVEKQPEPKKREKKKEKAPEEQEARQASTQVRAPKSDRTAAPQTDAGAASPRQVASWQSKVNATVSRHMRRTRISGRGGAVTVNVSFTLQPNGQVAGARLASSSGDAGNDAALSRQITRMPRLPPHPSGKSIALTLPIVIERR